MAVFDRQQKSVRRMFNRRATAFFWLHGAIDLRSGLNQSHCDIRVAFPHCEEKRSESGCERRAEVAISFEERIDNFQVAFSGSPHECGLFLLVMSINVGAMREQRFNGTE